jgi:hypothetical protein
MARPAPHPVARCTRRVHGGHAWGARARVLPPPRMHACVHQTPLPLTTMPSMPKTSEDENDGRRSPHGLTRPAIIDGCGREDAAMAWVPPSWALQGGQGRLRRPPKLRGSWGDAQQPDGAGERAAACRG